MILESTGFAAPAHRLAALGDPTRLRIVAILRRGPRCVCELQELLGIAPNLLSYHLKVLRQADVIAATRRGRWIDYQLVPGTLEALARHLDEGTP
jgi:ArsR family transcriptional regulator